jgi:hypothetical protein
MDDRSFLTPTRIAEGLAVPTFFVFQKSLRVSHHPPRPKSKQAEMILQSDLK